MRCVALFTAAAVALCANLLSVDAKTLGMTLPATPAAAPTKYTFQNDEGKNMTGLTMPQILQLLGYKVCTDGVVRPDPVALGSTDVDDGKELSAKEAEKAAKEAAKAQEKAQKAAEKAARAAEKAGEKAARAAEKAARAAEKEAAKVAKAAAKAAKDAANNGGIGFDNAKGSEKPGVVRPATPAPTTPATAKPATPTEPASTPTPAATSAGPAAQEPVTQAPLPTAAATTQPPVTPAPTTAAPTLAPTPAPVVDENTCTAEELAEVAAFLASPVAA